jgi:tRNA threonylcarbamoyladenosine biosynthesis protein TsaB
MTALSIDTATESLGLCLEANGQRRTYIAEAGLRHSEALLPGIRRLLDEAGIAARDLELVVCCRGPGSFTGIRIGLATAKGLCFGNRIPLIGIANLDAMAFSFRRFGGVVVPVLAALRRHYYAAVYRRGERISEYLAMTLDKLIEYVRHQPNVLLTGPAAEALFEGLSTEARSAGDPSLSPSHEGIAGVASAPAVASAPSAPSRSVASAPAVASAPSAPILDLGSGSTDPISLLELGKRELARLGTPTEEPEPLYLRKSDAEISRGG